MSRPRLVATDLDGTVVRADGTISARTVDALRLATDAGALVVFVTGRPPRWMARIAEVTGHRGLAICANGALVYDLATERVVQARLLEAEVVAKLMTALADAVPGLRFAVESETRMLHEEHFELSWDEDHPGAAMARELSELSGAGAAKLLVRHPDTSADALLARTREVVGDLAELTHSSLGGLVEISAAGVTKATTLAALSAERDIDPADVLAFGDMPNDLAMLAWAGTAYAVANAHPDVLASVERHTAGVEDDGVALVLERVFGSSAGSSADAATAASPGLSAGAATEATPAGTGGGA